MEKVVFFEIEKWEEDYVRNSLSGFELIFTNEKLTAENVEKFSDVKLISTFIYSDLKREVLEKMPDLKFIATRSMGFDHIDVSYCKEKGIVVSNVPAYGVNTVSEHTFALILALSRKLLPSLERAKKGNFSSNGLEGIDIYGKTLGVVGTGHIGKNVAEIGLSFGMKVLAYSRNQDNSLMERGVKYVPLEELLANSDFITLHLPYSEDTKHIINSSNIEIFKKGSFLVNTARGGLVETSSILLGLEKGILSGVGLDVLEEEVGLKEERELVSSEYLKKVNVETELLNHVLLTREDVLITPHNAFNSKEALNQIIETTIENITSFISSSPVNTI